MKNQKSLKIVLVGAGGMSFAPVMISDLTKTPSLEGVTLSLMDIDEKRLDTASKIAKRMDQEMGGHFSSIEAHTNLEDSVKDADFAMIAVEVRRFPSWDQDYQIPRRYGSPQIMGENGGPGGTFHALRTAYLVSDICKKIEKVNPDCFIINFTNPMAPVTLSINKATNLKNIGLCHEFTGGVIALSKTMFISAKKIAAKASGTNHFTWFYEIKHKETGQDLYPKAIRHFKKYPWLHHPLVRHCVSKYGLITTTSDDHMGEYLDFAHHYAKPADFKRRVYHFDCQVREWLVNRYAKGKLPFRARRIPKSHEEAIPIVEAMVHGKERKFNAVNVPNRGYIPNLPEDMIVEVRYKVENGEIKPEKCPPVHDELAEVMKFRAEIQEMVVEAALTGDRDLAFEAILKDPISPPGKEACRKMFDEILKIQSDLLPF